MLLFPRHHTPWLTAAVVAIVTCAELSLVAIAAAARRMAVPPADPDESWLEMIDQSPLTSTHPAPRLLESARLKSSLKLATATSLSGRHAACGVSATESVERGKVSADAHALDGVSATVNRSVPALLAVHTEMWVSVSLVPPFVHADGGVPSDSADPDEEDEKTKLLRVVEPTEMLEVPAAPGSPVCSCTNVPATALYAAPPLPVVRSVLSHPETRLGASPAVIARSPRAQRCRRRVGRG